MTTILENTYGIKCEFNAGGQLYTYLVDYETQGDINAGDFVVVATPDDKYKVIRVIAIATDLAPVAYMKYIVARVDRSHYDRLMKAFTKGDAGSTEPHVEATE